MDLGCQLHASAVLLSTKDPRWKEVCVGHGGVRNTLGKEKYSCPYREFNNYTVYRLSIRTI